MVGESVKKQLFVDSNDIVFLAQFASAGFIPDSKTHCFRFQFVAQSSGRLYTVGLSKATLGWEINAPYHPNTFKKPKTAKEIGKMISKLIGSKGRKEFVPTNLTKENIDRLLNHLDLTEETFLADNRDWEENGSWDVDWDFDKICDKLKKLRSKVRR